MIFLLKKLYKKEKISRKKYTPLLVYAFSLSQTGRTHQHGKA